MKRSSFIRRALQLEWPFLGLLVGVTLLAHLLTATNYPMFRDEFYYLECASHLDYGYVDHPPLSIYGLDVWRAVFGDSLSAVRFLPALAAAALVWLVWRITKEFGGGLLACTLAGLAAFISPQQRALMGFFSMNAFDLLFWAAAVLILIRIVKADEPRLWIPFGLIAGFGLLNKISLLYLGAGLVIGMILTPLRKHFLRRHFWIGGLIAMLLFLPYVIWQFTHDFATLEFIHNATTYKNAVYWPHEFLLEFALENNPLTALLWLAGIVTLFTWERLKPFRILGWVTVVALAILMTQKGKPYYAAGLFPLLIAPGAVWLENLVSVPRWKWVRVAYPALLIVGGAVLLPFGLRLLLPQTYINYQNALGIKGKANERGHEDAVWPQHYSDSFGWAELTRATAKAFDVLTPEQQQDCVILTGNYGEAGAINYYGRESKLPHAYTTNNSCYFWGPPEVTPNTSYLIVLRHQDDPRNWFDFATIGGASDSPYAMPSERNLLVYICRGPKLSIADLWKQRKDFE